MTKCRSTIGAACLALWAMHPALTHAQKFGTPASRQLIVESSYLYTRYPYAEALGFMAGKDLPAMEQAGPEMALARYLTALAKGQVSESLAAWTADSQKLIRKKIAAFPKASCAQAWWPPITACASTCWPAWSTATVDYHPLSKTLAAGSTPAHPLYDYVYRIDVRNAGAAEFSVPLLQKVPPGKFNCPMVNGKLTGDCKAQD
jgi:hypothetical protein